ncbi:Uncharacterised protein [Candidatus Gugararchaeum adminiculabundum]|nr:Uncharacterised protein [Candidatus Gugararchaeum adminiculabundum]
MARTTPQKYKKADEISIGIRWARSIDAKLDARDKEISENKEDIFV